MNAVLDALIERLTVFLTDVYPPVLASTGQLQEKRMR